jgi:hypothetical protein
MNRNDTVGIVMAHAGAKETVVRHLPYWLKVCGRIIIVLPEGETLGLCTENVEEFSRVPNGGGYSKETNIRTYQALHIARHSFPSPYYILFEYDSLCWRDIPEECVPQVNAMTACRWPNEAVSPIGKPFKGSFYLHFPHIYSVGALDKLLPVMERHVPWDAEYGYTDRYLGLCVERACIKVVDTLMMGKAYSFENISKHPARVNDCIYGVRNRGIVFSHGIKDEESLRLIAKGCQWGVL